MNYDDISNNEVQVNVPKQNDDSKEHYSCIHHECQTNVQACFSVPEVETVPGRCPGPAALGASCEVTEAGGQQTEPGRTGEGEKRQRQKKR